MNTLYRRYKTHNQDRKTSYKKKQDDEKYK